MRNLENGEPCEVRGCTQYRIVLMPIGQFISTKENRGLGNYHLPYLWLQTTVTNRQHRMLGKNRSFWSGQLRFAS